MKEDLKKFDAVLAEGNVTPRKAVNPDVLTGFL
jgi:hypothetical protein